MSDVSQGPGWWLASDGKWYPPSASPGSVAPQPGPDTSFLPGHPGAGSAASPSTGPGVPFTPAGPPSYGPLPAGSGAPPPGYAPPMAPSYGYPAGGPAYEFAPPVQSNGLAIASLICSLVGLGILGIIFGFIARGQIKRSAGQQQGDGLALAGIIIGFVEIVAIGVIIAVFALFVHDINQICHQNGNCTFNTNNFGNS